MKLTYLFDPLCGWCYAAAPAIRALADAGLAIDALPTGLFAGEGGRAMDAAFSAYAWENDQRIAALTGQPFSDAYRQNVLKAGGRFDSTAATLAVVAAGPRGLEALSLLQHARYVDGRDTSDADVVARIIADAGLPPVTDQTRAACHDRITHARCLMAQFGARGVPVLILEDGRGARLLPSQMLYDNTTDLVAQPAA
ncbi:MAG: DsbA family protein [Paracoccus sp. (in: a-proteobacteria)]|nr:DsbA family protein [Paracoccus sp. (in: a-proteobacteria)]